MSSPKRTHTLDPAVADELSVNAALIYSHIRHFCAMKENEADARSFHDGRYWIFNSVSSFREWFFYLSDKQIRTALDQLIEASYIKVGEFNRANFDRTKWYADLRSAVNVHLPSGADGYALKGNTVCPQGQTNTIETNIDTNISLDDGFEQFYLAHGKMVDKKPALAIWKKNKLSKNKDQIINAAKVYASTREKKFRASPKIWLRDEKWTDADVSTQSTSSSSIDWKVRIDAYVSNGTWLPDWGARPDMSGCKAPQELLKSLEQSNV